jgi:hypothetical protein
VNRQQRRACKRGASGELKKRACKRGASGELKKRASGEPGKRKFKRRASGGFKIWESRELECCWALHDAGFCKTVESWYSGMIISVFHTSFTPPNLSSYCEKNA